MLVKLKHEWKTFLFAVASCVVGLYDGIVSAALDWTPFIPEKYRPYAPFVVGFGMLLLRRWTDRNVADTSLQTTPEPSDVSDPGVQQVDRRVGPEVQS